MFITGHKVSVSKGVVRDKYYLVCEEEESLCAECDDDLSLIYPLEFESRTDAENSAKAWNRFTQGVKL